jgi:hypothetical protein
VTFQAGFLSCLEKCPKRVNEKIPISKRDPTKFANGITDISGCQEDFQN